MAAAPALRLTPAATFPAPLTELLPAPLAELLPAPLPSCSDDAPPAAQPHDPCRTAGRALSGHCARAAPRRDWVSKGEWRGGASGLYQVQRAEGGLDVHPPLRREAGGSGAVLLRLRAQASFLPRLRREFCVLGAWVCVVGSVAEWPS